MLSLDGYQQGHLTNYALPASLFLKNVVKPIPRAHLFRCEFRFSSICAKYVKTVRPTPKTQHLHPSSSKLNETFTEVKIIRINTFESKVKQNKGQKFCDYCESNTGWFGSVGTQPQRTVITT